MSAGRVDPRWVERILAAEPTVGPVRLVCVDGPAGSGKTTFASDLAVALATTYGHVPVVHGDEVYEGWAVVVGAPDRVSAFGALGDRIESWLLTPWRNAAVASFPVWDWASEAWGPLRDVPAAPVVVLEGVALASHALRQHAVLSVWVDAGDAERLRRVLDRDGAAIREQMLTWQRDEAAWHQRDGTREGADVRLSTG